MSADISGQHNFPHIVSPQPEQAVVLSAFAASVFFLVLCFICSDFASTLSASKISNLKDLMDENSDKKLVRAVRMKENMKRYYNCAYTGLFINAAFSLLSSTLAFFPLLYNAFSAYINDLTSSVISLIIIIVIFTSIFTGIVFLIPKRMSEVSPEKHLVKLSGAFQAISVLYMPALLFSSGLYIIIMKFLGRSISRKNDAVTEEKILMMVDEGEETGLIEEKTKNMIENVFDFDYTTVGEIMTHRKDIVSVRDDETISGITKAAIESGRSRILVYHDDIDNITGMIHAKDLLKYIGSESAEDVSVKDLIRTVTYVPESKRCSDMFKYMTANKLQIAVVVDEFGGTGGIITMEDLIESILGSIQDEYDNEDEEIKKVNEYSFSVDGSTSLDEIEDLTDINFEDDENDTIAGLMLDRMGHIPKSGEHPSVMINGTRFTVTEVTDRRISKVLIVKNHSKKKNEQ